MPLAPLWGTVQRQHRESGWGERTLSPHCLGNLWFGVRTSTGAPSTPGKHAPTRGPHAGAAAWAGSGRSSQARCSSSPPRISHQETPDGPTDRPLPRATSDGSQRGVSSAAGGFREKRPLRFPVTEDRTAPPPGLHAPLLHQDKLWEGRRNSANEAAGLAPSDAACHRASLCCLRNGDAVTSLRDIITKDGSCPDKQRHLWVTTLQPLPVGSSRQDVTPSAKCLTPAAPDPMVLWHRLVQLKPHSRGR